MSWETTGSTVPRRELGRRLRRLREEAGVTIAMASRKLEWSSPKIWRIEKGEVGMRSLDVRQMCELYGAEAETTASLEALAKQTKVKDWWRIYRDAIPHSLDLFLGLEEAADTFRWYESHLFPGIAQTERYMRAVLQTDHTLSADEIDTRVEVRLNRQAILRRKIDPPRYDFIVDEDTLRRPVVPSDVMAEQLDHVVKLTELPNVTLRIVPYSAGLHPGVRSGPFVILGFPQTTRSGFSEPDTVYIEDFTGGLYLDKPSDVERYADAFDRLRERSLDESATKDLMRQVARSLK
ncbi:MAG TPA: helix-turn-helix transcriptional regulator [Micromonosporaceae bacterium]